MPPLERKPEIHQRVLPDDYFSTGVWSATTPNAQFRRYTCIICGHHSATMTTFREHRAGCTDQSIPADERPDVYGYGTGDQ